MLELTLLNITQAKSNADDTGVKGQQNFADWLNNKNSNNQSIQLNSTVVPAEIEIEIETEAESLPGTDITDLHGEKSNLVASSEDTSTHSLNIKPQINEQLNDVTFKNDLSEIDSTKHGLVEKIAQVEQSKHETGSNAFNLTQLHYNLASAIYNSKSDTPDVLLNPAVDLPEPGNSSLASAVDFAEKLKSIRLEIDKTNVSIDKLNLSLESSEYLSFFQAESQLNHFEHTLSSTVEKIEQLISWGQMANGYLSQQSGTEFSVTNFATRKASLASVHSPLFNQITSGQSIKLDSIVFQVQVKPLQSGFTQTSRSAKSIEANKLTQQITSSQRVYFGQEYAQQAMHLLLMSNGEIKLAIRDYFNKEQSVEKLHDWLSQIKQFSQSKQINHYTFNGKIMWQRGDHNAS